MSPSEELFFSGNEANGRGEFALAAERYRLALALTPAWPEARHNYASVLYQLGQTDEALEEFRNAHAGPSAVLSRGMLAVIAPGAPAADNQLILDARKDWARIIATERLSTSRISRPEESGPLRIGYFCSFFERENYMKPVWALINRHDRDQFEVHLISDSARETIRSGYRPHNGDTFHFTGDLNITDCARAIETAELDLLIDLNAYSRWRRLPVYSLKPAPIIASWFNSYATTGMSSIDYLIGDSVVAPPEEDAFYCEEVMRVSGSYLTFEVSYPVPPVTRPPCFVKHGITFGSLAPLYKITPPVISAWSKILDAVPATTLLLKNSALASAANREYLLNLFAQQAIDKSRLQFEGPSDHFQYLQAYDRIDIALDTFPYNGGTTTTEAIWQGVPVITFYGDRWAARTSASILRAGSLGQFVASDIHRYVELAATLGTDPTTPEMLAELRQRMRDRLTSSSVCDTRQFAIQMEALYRKMCSDKQFTEPASP